PEPEDVGVALAVGADGAPALAGEEREFPRRRRVVLHEDLLLPHVAAVSGPGDDQRVRVRADARAAFVVLEAEVDVAERGAGGRVVRPDLLLVGESRRTA